MRAEKPDDKSVMTYVSEFFHRFASQGEADTAGRRVGNFVNFSQAKVRTATVHGGVRETASARQRSHPRGGAPSPRAVGRHVRTTS